MKTRFWIGSRLICLLSLGLALFIPGLVSGGTLDDAPFRIVVPKAGWKVEDSTAQPMGKEVFLIATISNTNTLVKSVVISTVLGKTTGSTLEEFCSAIRSSLESPVVKTISESGTKFLGFPARTFTYEITQGGQTIYNEATVFIADGRGWTIACVGRGDQKDEVKKMISYYQKKAR